jgi:hypothetical protein
VCFLGFIFESFASIPNQLEDAVADEPTTAKPSQE